MALAFAIMFTVNMLSGPPGSSSTGTAGPSAGANDCRSHQRVASADGDQRATPPPTRAKPPKTASSREGGVRRPHRRWPGAIAVAVLGNQAAAYVCDGRNVESWFRGTVEGGHISLKSKSGATLQAELDGDHLKGTVQINNDTQKFEINEANKPAGLYRGVGPRRPLDGSCLRMGRR